jgi:hypothetical protein
MARQSVPRRISTTKAITLEYDGRKVHLTPERWINATEKAEHYGKRLDHWLASKETKAYLDALARALNYPNSGEFVKVKEGRNGGTWLHPKLGVAFARWLNPDFAVWLDLQNDAMLRGTHPCSSPPRDSLTVEKRQVHSPMMDAKKYTLEAVLGVESTAADFIKENHFCNRALTGKYGPLDESALDNYEMKLLTAIRRQNAVLIPHYPSQTKPGVNGKIRKELMDAFVLEWRIKNPRPRLN